MLCDDIKVIDFLHDRDFFPDDNGAWGRIKKFLVFCFNHNSDGSCDMDGCVRKTSFIETCSKSGVLGDYMAALNNKESLPTDKQLSKPAIAAIAERLNKLNYYGAKYHMREIHSVVVELRQLSGI